MSEHLDIYNNYSIQNIIVNIKKYDTNLNLIWNLDIDTILRNNEEIPIKSYLSDYLTENLDNVILSCKIDNLDNLILVIAFKQNTDNLHSHLNVVKINNYGQILKTTSYYFSSQYIFNNIVDVFDTLELSFLNNQTKKIEIKKVDELALSLISFIVSMITII